MEPYTGERLACETGEEKAARLMKLAASAIDFHVGLVGSRFGSFWLVAGRFDFGGMFEEAIVNFGVNQRYFRSDRGRLPSS